MLQQRSKRAHFQYSDTIFSTKIVPIGGWTPIRISSGGRTSFTTMATEKPETAMFRSIVYAPVIFRSSQLPAKLEFLFML